MSNYVYIPVIALFCYSFLILAFSAAKKNRIINSFIFVLVGMILWTGGSLCMRIQFWPSVKFWYDLSILGLTLLPYTLFCYTSEFIGNKNTFTRNLWLVSIVIINIINIKTGVFLACPEVVISEAGQVGFFYHFDWPVIILFTLCGLIVCNLFYNLYKKSKTDELISRQLAPILMGIAILFLGHILVTFSIFRGFPIDILSGVINAIFMFYALYKRRLFKLTLLVSRGSCYVIATVLSVGIFSNFIPYLQHFIIRNFNTIEKNVVLFISVVFTLATFIIYFCMKKFIDRVFIREEIMQAENLKNFGLKASKSLNQEEILEELIEVVNKTIMVKHIYVCTQSSDNTSYVIAHSSSPLDRKTFYLKIDNPIVTLLSKSNECLLMKEFKRTIEYKSMWEEEKQQLAEMGIECFVPLKDENTLVGLVLLSEKEKNLPFTYDDMNFLDSVNSIGSIAVKNSRLYEKVYYEARTDELTSLLNRKYFYQVIQREYEKYQDQSLSLIILNIDDFKLYNQLYGNKEGDIALQEIAHIIQASVGTNGYVARYSGKEFAVILPQYDLLAAKNLAFSIRDQIMNRNKRSSDHSFKVLTVSGGVCSFPYAASNVKQLIDNADMAVYHVKRNGKNNIKVYSMGEQITNNEVLVNLEKKESAYSEYAATIYALTAAIDTKDHYTFNHSKNVAEYASKLAYAAGLNEECIEIVREAALLHDIGKIGVPEHILNKPGKLTTEEYEIMKGHVENSIGIIRHLPSLDYLIPAVIGHHEHYNGKGYPRKLTGEEIPISARILCIADSFEAMTSIRPYKEAYSLERALNILIEESGKQFDRNLVYLFINLIKNGTIDLALQERA